MLFLLNLILIILNNRAAFGINSKLEFNLTQSLLKHYNKEMRPSDHVEIKFALNLNQIVTMIEKEQILVLNVFLDHEWVDERLRWSPEDYQNITLLRINSDFLWTFVSLLY